MPSRKNLPERQQARRQRAADRSARTGGPSLAAQHGGVTTSWPEKCQAELQGFLPDNGVKKASIFGGIPQICRVLNHALDGVGNLIYGCLLLGAIVVGFSLALPMVEISFYAVGILSLVCGLAAIPPLLLWNWWNHQKKIGKSEKIAEISNEKLNRIRGLLSTVIPKYALIMENSPLIIFPSSHLPIPKDEMKIALRLAWAMTEEPHVREAIGAGYLHLSNFRDDIENPIDLAVRQRMSPAQAAKSLEPFLAISRDWEEEGRRLFEEFTEFKRVSCGHP